MTRADASALTDLELTVCLDRCRMTLARAWERGEPGSLSDVYDMALIYTECAIRGGIPRPLTPKGWMPLFEVPGGRP